MAELAIVTATVGKIARDVALLSQAEVGEMLESLPAKGVGGSSAMPHKRNPVACLQALAAAARAPGLMATLFSGALGEHERALGGWRAELATIPELVGAAGSALDALERIAEGLVVNAERMKANLESLQGLVFSERLARLLARDTDRARALALVDDWSALAVREHRHLRDVAIAAQPSLAGHVDGVFSLEAIVTGLARHATSPGDPGGLSRHGGLRLGRAEAMALGPPAPSLPHAPPLPSLQKELQQAGGAGEVPPRRTSAPLLARLPYGAIDPARN